jgi:hypothetical protein
MSPQIGSYGIMPFDAKDKNICIDGLGETKECANRLDATFKSQYQFKCSYKQFCILDKLDTYFNGASDR